MAWHQHGMRGMAKTSAQRKWRRSIWQHHRRASYSHRSAHAYLNGGKHGGIKNNGGSRKAVTSS